MPLALHHRYMSRAIQLADKGRYSSMPNPRVGCVIVNNGQVVGEGFHRKAGEPHAEIHALTAAGTKARGATVYTTLEPCSHNGRTPPCANALIKAGISHAVISMTDPNPQVSGQGIAMLSRAGITITQNVLQQEAEQLNPGFIRRMKTGRPYMRAKLAMSLDGRTAMASGESQWITGPEARRSVQRLRAQSCAIITGGGSILHDNSSLTVRTDESGLSDAATGQRQPLRVVLDSSLQTPVDSKVLHGAGRALMVCTERAEPKKVALIEQTGAEVLMLPAKNNRVSLESLMVVLGQRECNEVLIETGATLAGAMLSEGLMDELIVFMAPTLMGSDARPLLQLPLQHMSQQYLLTIEDIRAVGRDWKITARPDRKQAAQ